MPNSKNNNKTSKLQQKQKQKQQQPSAKKKKRNRKNGKANSNFAGQPARSTHTIVKSLVSGMSSLNLDSYMACRLTGIAPQSTMSIPDGKSGKHVNACYWTTNVLTFSAQVPKVTFWLVPWLPCPLLAVCSGPNARIDGYSISEYTNLVTPVGGAVVLTPTGANLTSPGNNSINPMGASKIRFSSISTRVRYTGPASTCAGMLQVYKQPISLGQAITVSNYGTQGSPPTQGVNLQLKDDAGIVVGYSNAGSTFRQYQGPANPGDSTPTCGVQFFRPEQGVSVRLSHPSQEYRQVEWFHEYAGVANNAEVTMTGSNEIVQNLLSFRTGSGAYVKTRSQGGVCAFDNDWEAVCIDIVAPNTDASFVFETCVCAEVTPSSESAFYAVAKDGSKANLPEIKMTEEAIKKSGPAVPLTNH